MAIHRVSFALVALFAVQSNAFVGKHEPQLRSLVVDKLGKTHHHHSPPLTALSMWGGDNDRLEGLDRVKGCFPYLLPLLDGDHFGRFIYYRIPALGLVDSILIQPLEAVYHAIPFGSLIFFFALSIGSRQSNLPRSVRFNAQQAVLIDIALIFPELLGSFSQASFPRAIVEPASNFVYYTYMAMIIYSISSNLAGKKPNQIPIISEAAEMSIGPF